MNPSIRERMLAGAIHGPETGHVLATTKVVLAIGAWFRSLQRTA